MQSNLQATVYVFLTLFLDAKLIYLKTGHVDFL